MPLIMSFFSSDLEKHHDGACGRLFFPEHQDPDYVEYVDDDDI